jgi:hypothetical protein
MRERLIFTSLEDQKKTSELIVKTFPSATVWELPQPSADLFTCEMEVDVDKEVFFEWAVVPNGDVHPIFSCLYLSLEMIDMPSWMRNILIKLKFADGKNLLGE